MKTLATTLGVIALSIAFGLVSAQDRPAGQPDRPPAGEPAAVPAERAADARALTDLLASFIKAYNAKDAKALGDLFTSDAEIEDEDGDVVRGRDAIIERFTKTFEEKDGDTLSVDTDSTRFLGTDVAIEDGTASLSAGANSTPRRNRYSVIYARQGGRWLHARIRDEPEEDVSPHDRLQDLEWMLGEWVNESDDEVVFTTCKWSDDGSYLLREFDVKIEGRSALRGTQRIGWDAQRGQYRAWVFDDGGGFAEGMISRDDERWVVKSSGVRSDGQTVSFTTTVTPLGKDRLRWEIFDRTLDGNVVPGTDQFDLVRRPPNPAK